MIALLPLVASFCRKVQQTPNDSFVGKLAIRIPTDNINKSINITIASTADLFELAPVVFKMTAERSQQNHCK